MVNSSKILAFCLEKGLLVDNEVLNLFKDTEDIESVKIIIDKLRRHTRQTIITKSVFNENREQVNQFFSDLPKESKLGMESLKSKLRLNIEISREISIKPREENYEIVESKRILNNGVKLINNYPVLNKKLAVGDFVKHFRNRFSRMSVILQQHPELTNLVSINKISGNRQGISIIGLVSDISVTKNKNIILEVEDLTGKIKVLINNNKEELVAKAEEVMLDSIIGFKASGTREILFVNDIVFPDCTLPERKRSSVDERVLFIGDLHFGSKLFMRENFLKFVDYLNGKVPGTEEEVSKIKYLFIVGDLISGVGNYPNQENELEIVNLEEQFAGIAEILGRIRKDIQIIISPGNHDAVRIMEPQPMFDEKFAWPLYEMENIILTSNPSTINIGAKEGFEGLNVLAYHGFSFFHYADNIIPLMKAKASHQPELILKFLLKHRHLSPTHGSNQYYPGEEDSNFIDVVPDILISGHVHKSGLSYYNNILIISVSTWERMTAYMEKVGSKPDFCKVPMLNLKTREVKILDFE